MNTSVSLKQFVIIDFTIIKFCLIKYQNRSHTKRREGNYPLTEKTQINQTQKIS